MPTPAIVAYTTIGSVRGQCGHRHRTPTAARECVSHDRAGCRSQGGYSDRIVAAIDREGYLWGLDGDTPDSYIWADGGRSLGAARAECRV